MIVRVRGKDGTFRFDMKDTDTVLALKKKIESETGVPVKEQAILTDLKNPATELKTDTMTLQKYAIKNGDMLFVKYNPQILSKQEMEEQEKKKKEADIPEELKSLRDMGMSWTLDQYLAWVEKNTIKVKHQDKPVCESVALEFSAANNFQSYLREMGFQLQRMGYLYGFENDEGGLEVDVIYEPPQENSHTGFIELEDPMADRVDGLASLLGMKKVGWIFSVPKRDYILSGQEIIKAAQMQSIYGKKFVTIVVSVNDEGNPEFEAYQVSDQGVELYNTSQLSTRPHTQSTQADSKKFANNDKAPTTEEESEKFVYTKKTAILESKETNRIDTTMLTVTVPIRQREGRFRVGFPISNRTISDYQPSIQTLANTLKARAKLSFIQRVMDFHLLLYLTNFLDVEAEMPVLIDALQTGNTEVASGYEQLISAYAGL